MSLNPNVIHSEDYTECVPHGSRDTSTTAFPPGRNGELRRCPGCKKWWFKDPEYTYIWQPVYWYHFSQMKIIREHERKIANSMHTLVHAEADIED